MTLAGWAESFLSLCRRLAPTTQETYARDLHGHVLPRFGTYRLGRIPADEIENWLNDELAAGVASSSVHRHYRTLRRMLTDLTNARSGAAERAQLDVDEVSLRALSESLTVRPLLKAFAHWFPAHGSPPEHFARHATAHAVGHPGLFTKRNALWR